MLEYCKLRGISKAELSQNCEISYTVFAPSAMKQSISSDSISSFLRHYSEISAEWLMRGEGEMLRTHGNGSVIAANISAPSTIGHHISTSPSPSPDSQQVALLREQAALLREQIETLRHENARKDAIIERLLPPR